MLERGVLEAEVGETVEEGELVGVRARRQIRRRVFRSGYERRGQVYPHKEITVVYVVEGGLATVITSIARYRTRAAGE